jgi:choline dehydrogenase
MASDMDTTRALAILAATSFVAMLACVQAAGDESYTFMKDAVQSPQVSYYDYIIVGGGTAGCPLAATLSQRFRVLLLERGGSPYDDERIGNMTRFADTLSDTSPSSPAQRFVSEDGVINSRPRVLGGGSCINAGFYTRASDEYVRGLGWDLEATTAAYRWVEDVVAFQPELGPWQSALERGLLEAGIAPQNGFTFDHLGGTKVGGSIFDAEGRRHTAADLLRYARTDGIDVLLRARVAKILFNVRGKDKTRFFTARQHVRGAPRNATRIYPNSVSFLQLEDGQWRTGWCSTIPRGRCTGLTSATAVATRSSSRRAPWAARSC